MTAEVTGRGLLDMQVCVPEGWTDYQVIQFAESQNPAGTTSGWQIRREGNELLAGCPERAACEKRTGHVHIVVEC